MIELTWCYPPQKKTAFVSKKATTVDVCQIRNDFERYPKLNTFNWDIDFWRDLRLQVG